MDIFGTRKSVRIPDVSLLSGLILRKMYGAGPRKLSMVTSVRIKRVSLKRRFTVLHLGACSKAHSTDGSDLLWDCVIESTPLIADTLGTAS